MDIALETGCMFVKDSPLLPPALRFEGKSYPRGWQLVVGLRSPDIDRCARHCGWSLIPMGSTMKRTAIHFRRTMGLERATGYLLGEAHKNAFNAMEITGISSRRFLGLHLVSVGANCRSLQKDSRLKDGPFTASRDADVGTIHSTERR